MMARVEDVVIVGAGIAGLATAVALKKAGVKALVLEKSDGLRTTGAALTLFPNAWCALDALGVSHHLASLYATIKKGYVTNIDTGEIQEMSFPASNGNDLVGPRSVHRKALLKALADELPPNSIRFASKPTAIETQEHEGSSISVIHLGDGTIIKAKVLIGCDGIHSVVARFLGLAEPVYAGRSAVRGLAVFPQGHGLDNNVQQYGGLNRRAGFVPLNDKEIYWFFGICLAKGADPSNDPEVIKREVIENYAKDLPPIYLDVVRHSDLSTLSWAPIMFRYPWHVVFGNVALWSSPSTSSSPKGIVITVPALVLMASVAAFFFFFLLSSLSSPCTCGGGAGIARVGYVSGPSVGVAEGGGGETIWSSKEDVEWVKDQIRVNGLHMQDNVLRKGINPRTRAQQLEDLLQFKGISHYEGPDLENHTALPCPGELLTEEHHSNYGEPWAGGRDVFEFLAQSSHLKPDSNVLEIGCGTLRVGLHFIRYLNPGHFHCLERDELSLMAAFRYELPSQGLLHKRPLIVKGDSMDFSRFGSNVVYDLIYASAVFLHMPDKLVWVGLERLTNKLKPYDGRIFVSHNIKFCSRLGGDECTKRLTSLGLEYVGKHTHDSLLFNHYEIWFEFRRTKA